MVDDEKNAENTPKASTAHFRILTRILTRDGILAHLLRSILRSPSCPFVHRFANRLIMKRSFCDLNVGKELELLELETGHFRV